MAERTERSGFRARFTDHIAAAVGTTKGLFLVSDGVPDGPFFRGLHVPAFVQQDGRYLAAVVDPRSGSTICTSDDGGATWREPVERPITFPTYASASLVQVWQLHADTSSATPVLYAGVQPAALFRSEDLGASFQLVRSLWDHPDRAGWRPGFGGLGLHTILTHPTRPGRLIVAVSSGGVYVSEDGAQSFEARNNGLEALGRPSPTADIRLCVHKLAIDARDPDVLWAQTHWGVHRSSDAGEHWEDVGRIGESFGLPSGFGFPIVTHPEEADTAYVFPLESDDFPFSANGDCAVYRTSDGGKRWEGVGRGLPRRNSYVSVLRDAFDVSTFPPFPLVLGTRAGDIFASADGGENWRRFIEHLPPVVCVRVLV
ncbi:MAG: sialidase family protein [Actinomycetota bacterium]|nr:sialidase family protein [Actinomycetota bacterium]